MENLVSEPRGFVELYDRMILAPAMRAMYGHGGFYNVGYWSPGTVGLEEACRALVRAHLDCVPDPGAIRRVLDAGCGLGGGAAQMARHFNQAQVTAINLSEAQIASAREQHPEVDFQVMDACRMTFPSARFDLILSIEAAFHFNTRVDFLKEALRVLRPGGLLVLTDILFTNTEWVGKWSVPAANLILNPADYDRQCRSVGFELQQRTDITAASWMGFCEHLRTVAGMPELAEGLKNSVLAYLLVCLRRPAE